MLKYILLTALSAGVFIQTWTIDANSQSAWCPPGSTIVPIPGGNMCRCPDGSLANINGCQQRQPQQSQQPERYKPPPYQPSTSQQQQVAGVGEAIEALSNGVKSFFMTEDQFNSVTWKGYYTDTALQQVQKNNSSIGIDKKYIDALLASPDESRPKQPAAQTFRPVETVKTAVQTVKSMFANPPKPSAQPAESSSYLKDLPTLQGTIKSAPQPSTTNVPDSSVTGFTKETIVAPPSKAETFVYCTLLRRC